MMRSHFRPHLLPAPEAYYQNEGHIFHGNGEWKSTTCPFHADHRPSLRVRLESGSFCCMVCGEKGGDVVAFQQKKYGQDFIEAAKSLGAWERS